VNVDVAIMSYEHGGRQELARIGCALHALFTIS